MFVDRLAGKSYRLPQPDAEHPESKADVARMYDKYQADVFRFCLKKLGNYEDAVDIVQESFCRMLRKPDRETIETPRLFLIETAENLIRDMKRAGRRRNEDQHVNLHLVADTDLSCPEPSAESRAQMRQGIELALGALSDLPPKCQAVFVMQRFLGYSYAEIAEELEIASVVGVKKYMMRALGHLRDRIDMDEIAVNGISDGWSLGEGTYNPAAE